MQITNNQLLIDRLTCGVVNVIISLRNFLFCLLNIGGMFIESRMLMQ